MENSEDMPRWLYLVLGGFLVLVLGFTLGVVSLASGSTEKQALASGVAGIAFVAVLFLFRNVIRRLKRLGLVVAATVAGFLAGLGYGLISQTPLTPLVPALGGALVMGAWALFGRQAPTAERPGNAPVAEE